MKDYLETLIEEKGRETSELIQFEEDKYKGHIMAWDVLIEFIDNHPQFHEDIKNTLTIIDYKNGDVFDYLRNLAKGMIEATK